MTRALNNYLRSGKFSKKVVYTPSGSAHLFRVGERYQLEGIGRAKLIAIRSDDNQTISDCKTVIPWQRVSLLTMRLDNGAEKHIVPSRPSKSGNLDIKSAIPLPDSKGIWLRR